MIYRSSTTMILFALAISGIACRADTDNYDEHVAITTIRDDIYDYDTETILDYNVTSIDLAEKAVEQFFTGHPKYGPRDKWSPVREIDGSFYRVVVKDEPSPRFQAVYVDKNGRKIKYFCPH